MYEEDKSFFVVRFRGGGGGEILRRHFQEFEDREDCPLSKRSSGKNWPAARIGHDGRVHARPSRLRGAQPRKRSGQFKFTEAISFAINCETQDEIDYFWEKLSADGGSTGRCGWLKDKFGLSWQINPVFLGDMLSHRDAGKANRVMNALMEMDKIDIAALEKAARRND